MVRVLLGAGITVVLTAATSVAGPLDEFYELEEQMAEAQNLYHAATHAEEGEDGANPAKSDPPPDIRPIILEKIDALAAKMRGKPDGAPIALGAFYWSWNLDLDLPHLHRRFENLVQYYADDHGLDDILPQVIFAGAGDDKPEPWIAALRKLSKAAKRTGAKLGALTTLGQLQLKLGNLPQATAAFRDLLALKPEKELADVAKGYIHEIDHLQIGMVAPDFTARTIDDKTVSLSSLRGKTVLLSFWASW